MSGLGKSQENEEEESQKQEKKPILSTLVTGANELSVGISIVVAVLLGIGVGLLLEKISGQKWIFWLGVVWGVAAAILNIYRAYQRVQREAKELAANPRYNYSGDNEDEEDN